MDNPTPPPDKSENKTLVNIAGAIGSAACGLAFIFVFFGSNSAWPAAAAIAALAVMGVCLAYFDSKKN